LQHNSSRTYKKNFACDHRRQFLFKKSTLKILKSNITQNDLRIGLSFSALKLLVGKSKCVNKILLQQIPKFSGRTKLLSSEMQAS